MDKIEKKNQKKIKKNDPSQFLTNQTRNLGHEIEMTQ